MSYARKRKT